MFAPIHWTDQFASAARVDALVAPVVDPLSGQPETKATPVEVEAVDAAWYGFALTRAKAATTGLRLLGAGADRGGWRLELAGLEEIADWDVFARKLFGLGAGRASSSPCATRARAPIAASRRKRRREIIGALFVSPTPVAAARAWACEQFALDEVKPLALLAGRPPRTCRDPGRKVCVCLNVGANTILDAIADKNL